MVNLVEVSNRISMRGPVRDPAAVAVVQVIRKAPGSRLTVSQSPSSLRTTPLPQTYLVSVNLAEHKLQIWEKVPKPNIRRRLSMVLCYLTSTIPVF